MIVMDQKISNEDLSQRKESLKIILAEINKQRERYYSMEKEIKAKYKGYCVACAGESIFVGNTMEEVETQLGNQLAYLVEKV